MAKKPIPKELEEDLAKAKHYKIGSQRRAVDDNISRVFDDSKERAMYDEIFGSVRRPSVGDNLLPRLLPQQAGGGAGLLAQKGSSGSDFTSTLLQRLRLVEEEAKDARNKLAEQVMKNEKLESQVKLLKSFTRDPEEAVRELDALKTENARLVHQIDEMEDFLSDYGLVWVGKHGKAAEAEESNSDGAEVNEHLVTYAVFAQAVQALNELIYAEPTKVVTSGAEAGSTQAAARRGRLVHASEAVAKVRVAFYQNGLFIQRGPFRACSSAPCASFIKDIMDGFFPSEFSKEYPDGVIFDLVDRQHTTFEEGQADPEDALSAQQLLSRLPVKKITKSGEIVDIRGDVARRLGAGAAGTDGCAQVKGPMVIDTEAHRLACAKDAPAQDEDVGAAGTRGSVATIQVKWMDGTTFLAKAFAMSTVREVKSDIARHMAVVLGRVVEPARLELRCAHPTRVLMDGATLLEAGLVPNGTVHARLLA